MKKYAVIDIGTNSMRLLLVTIEKGKITERKKYMNTTRIGCSVDKNKVISEESITRNVEAFCNFIQKAKKYGVDEISAIATSGVRDAKNKEEFVQAVYQKTKTDIRIVSGKEEAELGYRGVMMGVECYSSTGVHSMATESNLHTVIVIDIGGGSTELMFGRGGVLKKTISLDIGAVRMTERFLVADPVDKEEYMDMVMTIYKMIEKAGQAERGLWLVKPEPEVSTTIVGIGGTITTLASLHQKLDPYDPKRTHNYELTLKDINTLKERLLTLTVDRIRQLRGIHPKRADIIIAGITILWIIMDILNLKKITVSEYDNLEGLLYPIMNK